MLRSEEEQYRSEAASRQETVLERQAKMRERAKTLRDRREAERLAFVEKKLDQRWRYNYIIYVYIAREVFSTGRIPGGHVASRADN